MEKLKMQTTNKADENFKKLSEMFPNAITETIDENGEVVRAIDKDILMQEINVKVVDGQEERYQFTWPEKKNAILLANSSISKTLRPFKNESIGKTGKIGDFSSSNVYIEGDNLEVLKILEKSYEGKIKMIYIDPPYNTGNNLIYKNDFTKTSKEYFLQSGQYDDYGNLLVKNLETNGRFHTDWLNMMYPRLKKAKNLLASDGILVCAIDENEVDTLSIMLKQIFGESSYEHTCVTVVHNPRGQQGTNFSHTNEYAIFVYPKGIKAIADRLIEDNDVSWSQFRNWGSESERTDAKNCFYPVIVKNGKIVDFGDVCDENFHPKQTEKVNDSYYIYPIDKNGIERKWRYARQSVESIKNMLKAKKSDNGYEIMIGKTFGRQKTVWNDKKYDSNEYGTKIINNLVPNNGFTFPKSLWTVYDAIYAGTSNDKNAIILDFFSGSATTAHAVMHLNSEDNGNRKFILVQVPEKIDEKSESFKNGFRNICDIGKARIKASGERILEENPDLKIDTGFRVLKCDTSNMKDVYYEPYKYNSNLIDTLEDNIKEDRTPEDLLFQVMIDLRIFLSSKIEENTISGKKVFNVDDNYLIACFDDNITEDVIVEIAKQEPYYFVLRDASLVSDSVATNFDQIFATYSPDTVRKVL